MLHFSNYESSPYASSLRTCLTDFNYHTAVGGKTLSPSEVKRYIVSFTVQNKNFLNEKVLCIVRVGQCLEECVLMYGVASILFYFRPCVCYLPRRYCRVIYARMSTVNRLVGAEAHSLA